MIDGKICSLAWVTRYSFERLSQWWWDFIARKLKSRSMFTSSDSFIVISWCNLRIVITKSTGQFEITEDATAVAIGPSSEEKTILMNDDKIKISRIKGYEYSDDFNTLKEITSDRLSGKLLWNDNWIIFMDSLKHMEIVLVKANFLGLPRIRKFVINPEVHQQIIEESAIDYQLNVQSPDTSILAEKFCKQTVSKTVDFL